MPDVDLIARELQQQFPRPSAGATARARAAVMQAAAERPGPARTADARSRWRPALVVAVAHATSGKHTRLGRLGRMPRGLRPVVVTLGIVTLLACAGVGIAAAFGAFEGTPAPPDVSTNFTQLNQLAGSAVQKDFYMNMPQTDASKAHGVLEIKTADGPEDLWAAPDNKGGRCYLIDFANDSSTNGILSIGGCQQSPAPPSNLSFSDVWIPSHPNLMTVYGSVYVPAATVQLTLDNGSTLTLPVVENLFIGSLPRGTKVNKVTAIDTAGSQVAEQTHPEHMILPR